MFMPCNLSQVQVLLQITWHVLNTGPRLGAYRQNAVADVDAM